MNDMITIPIAFVRRVARMRDAQQNGDPRHATEFERLVDMDLKVIVKLIADLELAADLHRTKERT